ncbi:hypothetical protein SanaruYs_34250 [Chryseotalea sanaruensis]|uniref:Secretion system C-terminal sorting domain-containing protein n=1 Tax=Chryseotalea sanaruensis TaxID=2482724 RepID=A0A401UE96_9BACT|nr:T9SS type A sorting domain-containing protein [Chryseotalea sanaruensis]GCC53182.1 hypothetical protein SanaruYs_34250 [Chryseotalea sanaruensis]
MLVDITATMLNPVGCALDANEIYVTNSVSVRLNNNLNVAVNSINGNATDGVSLNTSIPLDGNTFSGSIVLSGSFSYSSLDCNGWNGTRDQLMRYTGNFSESIPINFTGLCIYGSQTYTNNTVRFRLTYSFRLVMSAPTVTYVSDVCNSSSVNLLVTNTAPSYTWQVLNPAGAWVSFRTDASNAIVATRQELQTAAGNGAYENRNVRVVESGCLTNLASPSSVVFNFWVPAPSISFIKTDQTCNNSKDGSVAVTISSASPSTVDDFIVYLHDPAIAIDPGTGLPPAITWQVLNNSSIYEFDNLGVNDSPREYFVSVVNNKNINLYGSCRSVTPNFTITNPSAIETTFTRVLKNGFDISCHGGSNGQVTAVPSGGVGGFKNFSWRKGTSNLNVGLPTITGRNAGWYTVSYRDANNCLASGNVELKQPNLLSVSIQSNNYAANGNYDVSCHNMQNGSITAIATGGAGGRNYKWSGGPAVATYSGLGIGNYAVTVTDGNGCLANSNIELTAPPSIAFTLTPTNITCPGLSTGSLTVSDVENAIGGIDTYAWSTGGNGSAIQNLSAGTYNVTITDEQGCTAYREQTLSDPLPYSLSITPQSDYDGNYISCSSASDGILNATLLEPDLDPAVGSFSWFKGGVNVGAGATVSNLNEGDYRVEAEYGNGCTVEETYFLEAPEPYTVNITPQSNYDGNVISCSTASDGILSATLLNENSLPVVGTFTWYKEEAIVGEGATASNLNEGNYNVEAEYGNGCTAEGTYFLEAPEPFVAIIAIQSNYNGSAISCHEAQDGALAVTLLDEGASITEVDFYTWYRNGEIIASGESLSNINNLNQADYSVVTTYMGVCTANTAITLSDPDPVEVNVQADSNYNGYIISCTGENNGSLLAIASGGTPGSYTYVWDNGTESSSLTNIGAGEYFVTATDINNCPAFSSFTIEDPPVLTAFIQTTSDFFGFPISCTGQSDGSLLAMATGGTNEYTFLWSTGVNSNVLSNIPAGNYEVTATDENGCTAQTNLSLIDPPAIEVSIAVISDYNGQAITCAGEANGRLEASATGGTNIFTYAWNIGTLGSIQNNLTAGLYQVLATDQNGCQGNAQQELVDPAPVVASVVNISDYNGFGVLCANDQNGFIAVTGAGGTGVFFYNWTDDYTETSNILSGIGSGMYTATITDSNGCSDQVFQQITEPTLLTLAVVNKNDITCFGGNNGSIAVEANGGVSNYTYAINLSEQTNETLFSTLMSGEYTLHAYDANNCYATISETLLQPSQIEINFENIEPAFCDDPRGSASAHVTGGILNYIYQWKNSVNDLIDEDSSIENLAAGLYSLLITDANNCEASKFLGIQATDGPVVVVEEIIPAKCSYSADGSIAMEVSDGDGPFTFQWQNGQSLATATNLASGEYFVIVQDVNNCITVSSGTVSAPSPLAISLIELKPPSCYGYSDGSIEVSGSGGIAPYAYDWGIFQGSLFPGRSKGNSYLTLYDANQCMALASYSMPEPTPLSLNLVSRILPTCYGECNGQMEVLAAGGNGSYLYNWDSGSQMALANNLCADSHTVSVQDAKGCALQTTYALGQPSQLTPRLLTLDSPDCHNGCDGELAVDATGGVGEYSYHWSNGHTDANPENLCSGAYTVTITDGNECETQQTHQLLNPVELTIELGESRTICEGQSHTLSIDGIWSSYQWSSNVNFQSEASQVEIDIAGQYWLAVTNALGCIARDTFLLATSNDLLGASFIIPAEANVQDTVAMIDITWPLAESITWQLPSDFDVLQDLNEVVYGKFLHAGVYNIGMHAQLGGCHDEVTKSISILGGISQEEEELLGYEEFVKVFEVFPNPTQGNFTISLQFIEETFATLSIWEVLTGKVVKQMNLKEAQDFSVNVDLQPLPTGAYVLRMDYRGGVKYLRFVVN